MITSVHNEMATSRGKIRHPHPPFDDLSLRIAVQEWLLSPVGAVSKYGHISDWRYGEQKIAQFRTHDLTKELSYVSTQIQAKLQWTLK
jgi:hypothetical protein